MKTNPKFTFFAILLALLSTAAWGQTGWNTSDAVTATNGTTYTLGSTVVSRTMNVPDNVTVYITNATSGATLDNGSNSITFNLQGSNARVYWDARISSTSLAIGVNGNGNGGEFIVRSGSIASSSGYAISISSITLKIQGGTVSNTGYGIAIYAWYGYVAVSSGTVRTNDGAAIYGFGTTVTISGGTVEAAGGNAIYDSYSYGSITIIGGTVRRSDGGGVISASTIVISGGTVEATNTSGDTHAISGNITISGGTVRTMTSSTNSSAISGNVNISGSAIIRVSNGKAIIGSGTVTISGDTVEATGSDAATRAIYLYNYSGTLSITGGTISSSNGFAIEASEDINLGNSPSITGKIRTGYNKLSPRTESPAFNPGSRIYTLDPSQYNIGQIMVNGGVNFINNFRLYDTEYALMAEDDNLIVTRNISSAAVTVTAPVLNETPSTSASKVTSSDNYSITSVTWTPTPTSNQFQPGTAYTVQVTLAATTGYAFQGLASSTINGYSASRTLSSNGAAVTLSYTFPATARYTGSGSISIEDWFFGETLQEPVLNTDVQEYANPIIEYSIRDADNWLDEVPTNAGEYTVKAIWAQTANYYGHEATYDFVIEKATGNFIPPFEEDISLTYNPEWTLGNIELPNGYEWVDDASTQLNEGEEQKFKVIYTDSSGNYKEVIGEVTVNVALPGNAEMPTISITTLPEKNTVSVGTEYTISVEANVGDGGTLSYQWHRNTFASNIGGAAVEGATDASLFLSPKTVGAFYYYVVVTNTNNFASENNTSTIASEVVTLNVIYAQEPTIITQPIGGTISAGAFSAMTVEANISDNGTLSYQWYSNASESNENGTAIAGATNELYSPSTSTVGTFYYYVAVTNTNNNEPDYPAIISSDVVALNVISAQEPAINTQPAGGTVSINASRILTVEASISDNGILSYQWYSSASESNENGTAIDGATNASYNPSTASVGTFYYYVIVTNTNKNAEGHTAMATSNSVAVYVVIPENAATPTITVQPSGGNSISAGTARTLTVSASVSASEGGTLSYQWYSNASANNMGGTIIVGATEASYIPGSTTAGTYYYYVVVTNTNNNASGNKTAAIASDVATLTVNNSSASTYNLTVNRNPADGGTVTINGTTINTSASYTIGASVTAVAIPASGYAFTNWSGASTSTDDTTTVHMGSSKTLTANFVRTYTLTINKILENGGTVTVNGTETTGNTVHNSGTEVTVVATPENGYVFTGWSGASESVEASITLSMSSNQILTANFIVENAATPNITSQPYNGTVLAGETPVPLTVEANASDGGTLSYQWYIASDAGNSAIEGATSSSYIPSTEIVGNHQYYAIITNTNSSTFNKISTATSDAATVTVTLQAPAEPREITIAMRDRASDGWNYNGALIISVNGEYLSTNPSLADGSSGTFTFIANVGDKINVYWSGNRSNEENAFAIYYSDAPPSTTFNPVADAANDNDAILVSRQYGDLTSGSDGALLGSFTVTPSVNTAIYTLTIISNPAEGGGATINGYAINGTASLYDGTQVTVAAVPVPGSTFIGWSDSEVSTDAAVTITMNSDKTLTANFEVNFYLITYNANGGGEAPESQEKIPSAEIALSNIVPAREGYAFFGWNTKADGNGKNYAPEEIYAVEASVTLYAQWIAHTYTVTFDANGGEGAPEAQTKTHDIELILSEAVPIRGGYVFLGWNTEANGKGTNYATGDSYTAEGEATLYARWRLTNQIDISNAEELREFATAVNSGTNYNGYIIALTDDIELNEGWTPIGNVLRYFEGVFDGQGYTISGLSINNGGTGATGLFGYIGENGQIKNTHVIATKIEGNVAGGLAGYYASSKPIENSSVKADSIVASSQSGGLVGRTYSALTIENSYFIGNVSSHYSGGLVGHADGTLTIENSYTMGNISGSYSGGLVGYLLNSNANISYSYTSVNVSGNSAGGIFGTSVSSGTINSVYYNSAGANRAGSSLTGIKALTDQMLKYKAFFSDWDFDDIWSIEEGVSYPYLKNNVPAELPGSDSSESDHSIAWYLNNPNSLIFEISTEKELKELAALVNQQLESFSDRTIKLMDDIELSEAWTPIGSDSSQSFQGIFDGQGYTISKLYVENVQYAGLFGYIGENGQIKNVNVLATQIRTSTNGNVYAGGLAGYYASSMPIENSSVKADSIVAITIYSSYSGGLVGWVNATLAIENSYAIGYVFASSTSGNYSSYSGGLVGYASSTLNIENSYATGDVSGSSSSYSSSYSGGLMGSGGGTISNSYATGNVSASFTGSSGGLVGRVYANLTIENSCATGDVSTSGSLSYSGGLVHTH